MWPFKKKPEVIDTPIRINGIGQIVQYNSLTGTVFSLSYSVNRGNRKLTVEIDIEKQNGQKI